MDQRFFRVPFAASGDKASVPDAVQTEGYVSFNQGYGPDYAKDPSADAHAKPVERESHNYLLNAITTAIRQYQTHGYPEWITPADNNGSAFGYDAGVVVVYNGALYLSLATSNIATPGADETKWQPYIQREATESEAKAGTGSTQIMTPRRVKTLASYLDDQVIEELKTQIAPVTVPIGGGMLWFTTVPPDGWLEANGQSFDRTANPKLSVIYPSGKLPDLRGLYPKHVSDTSKIGVRSAGTDLNHFHLTGKFDGTSGQSADDLYIITRSSNAWGSESYQAQFLTGDYQRLLMGTIPAGRSGNTTGTSSWRNPDNTLGAPVAEPNSMGCIIIIKTDLAEAEEGTAAPTAIVVSPASATMQAGKTQQFSATVLPSSIASNFPVSWAVSDATLGSISSSGLYTAAAGVSGTQTIIASISTGLTQTATVTQHIWLTSITIGALPSELIAGESYNIAITYAPSNYSETVIASSSDSSVATLTSTGTLTVSGAGTATLSLTGALSGVTKSVSVTTKEVIPPEVYLQIANSLSEIADAGEEAQAEAQLNLGLGTLATQDSLSASDTGAVPLSSGTIAAGINLDTLTEAGQYFQNVSSNATTALNYPATVAGALAVYKTGVDAGGCRQVYMPYNSTVEYRRYAYGSSLVFSAWDAK